MIECEGIKYSSKKHPILEYIFKKYFNEKGKVEKIIFYLSDISDGYRKCGISEPVSISNTILDLCRQDRGINSRVPKSISDLGYDLRKKTGQDADGRKYAGEFVLVGVGNALKSWLEWPPESEMQIVTVDSSPIPEIVHDLIRPDEGGLFSIIDYSSVFTETLDSGNVFRIQNPMKWQPNEIDGFYCSYSNKEITIFPVEAKALTTGDEINLDQLQGGYRTVCKHIKKIGLKADIQQIAIKMIKNGILIAKFEKNENPEVPKKVIKVIFDPIIKNWQ